MKPSTTTQLGLTLAGMLAFVVPVRVHANAITLDINALIDGRDQLIVQGDTLQWHHFDFAAVGRHNGQNQPTIITSTLNGITQMDHVAWVPVWPSPPPDEIRHEAFSSLFTGLLPSIPQHEMSVTLEIIAARRIIQFIQLPSLTNNYTTILEFNDNAAGSDFYYEARITLQDAPEPASAVLLLGGGALLTLRRRRSPAGA